MSNKFQGHDRIETKDKRQITKDWLRFFPSFKEYKPMWMLRRHGAFICGIHLRRTSSNIYYEPLFHIHNLMADFPVISLSAAASLLNRKGAREVITLRQHKEKFADYAERFKQQIPLLHKDALSCDDLVAYLKQAVENYIGYPASELRDIILTLFWCGKTEEAEIELENAREIMLQWDNRVLAIRENGVEGWIQETKKMMDKDSLRATMEINLRKYKIEEFADCKLTE
jgi:hypothetical protein